MVEWCWESSTYSLQKSYSLRRLQNWEINLGTILLQDLTFVTYRGRGKFQHLWKRSVGSTVHNSVILDLWCGFSRGGCRSCHASRDQGSKNSKCKYWECISLCRALHISHSRPPPEPGRVCYLLLDVFTAALKFLATFWYMDWFILQFKNHSRSSLSRS